MKETLEQFLARGGTIIKADPMPYSTDTKISINLSASPNSIFALDEGALYFADKTMSRKTSTKVKLSKPPKIRAPKLNISLLPPHIAALVTPVEEAADEEAQKSKVLCERG